uniref:Uncharacterized protein n=1 Tax=Cucumis melo TaxID=3656 RepID=A0A9I9EBB8_CUCME
MIPLGPTKSPSPSFNQPSLAMVTFPNGPILREGLFGWLLYELSFDPYGANTNLESCEEDRSTLKQRLAASFVEIERQNHSGTKQIKRENNDSKVRIIELSIEVKYKNMGTKDVGKNNCSVLRELIDLC